MRQQRNDKFTELLNRVRIGLLTDEDHKILSERNVRNQTITILEKQCIFGPKISLLMHITKKCLTPLMESLVQ